MMVTQVYVGNCFKHHSNHHLHHLHTSTKMWPANLWMAKQAQMGPHLKTFWRAWMTREVFWKKCCYKLVQGFRVTCLFTGQYNNKGYDMITDVIKLLVGSASCWLDQGITPSTIFNWLLGFGAKIAYCSLFNICAIILRPDIYNNIHHATKQKQIYS